MDEPGGFRLNRRLRCGLGGRLLEWRAGHHREKSGTCAKGAI